MPHNAPEGKVRLGPDPLVTPYRRSNSSQLHTSGSPRESQCFVAPAATGLVAGVVLSVGEERALRGMAPSARLKRAEKQLAIGADSSDRPTNADAAVND
jgi:hypothetical protein